MYVQTRLQFTHFSNPNYLIATNPFWTTAVITQLVKKSASFVDHNDSSPVHINQTPGPHHEPVKSSALPHTVDKL